MTAEGKRGEKWRDMGAMWNAMIGRCPNCGASEAFASLWGLKPTCDKCGVRFEREAGAWLGAWVLAYAAATLALIVLALVLILNFGLFAGLEWVLVVAGALFVVVLYRPVKGWWLWWLWAAGFITRDGEPD